MDSYSCNSACEDIIDGHIEALFRGVLLKGCNRIEGFLVGYDCQTLHAQLGHHFLVDLLCAGRISLDKVVALLRVNGNSLQELLVSVCIVHYKFHIYNLLSKISPSRPLPGR